MRKELEETSDEDLLDHLEKGEGLRLLGQDKLEWTTIVGPPRDSKTPDYEQRVRELESIIESNKHLIGLDPYGTNPEPEPAPTSATVAPKVSL